jgi:hypothetical protein
MKTLAGLIVTLAYKANQEYLEFLETLELDKNKVMKSDELYIKQEEWTCLQIRMEMTLSTMYLTHLANNSLVDWRKTALQTRTRVSKLST